jgi:hypothetical protein
MNCERRKSRSILSGDSLLSARIVLFGCILILLLTATGCAAPGAPIARQPATAQAITDLAAIQSGKSVVLTFTLPKVTLPGQPLEEPPQIRIYREFLTAPEQTEQPGQPQAPGKIILEVGPQESTQYREGARMRIPIALTPADLTEHAGEEAVFAVRTRISGHVSADSNLAVVRVLLPPEPVQTLKSKITKSAIEISWTPVSVPAAGAQRPVSVLYRVYRAELALSATQAGSATSPAQTLPFSKFQLRGEVASPPFSDGNFRFGQTYAYEVRSVARYESGEVESGDSKVLEITPQNAFPPSAPEGLVVAFIPAMGTGLAHVDLSWAISPETDIAGYNVYRSESAASLGEKLNGQLLLAPVYRDNSILLGHRYFYRATAVDRLGKESAPSAAGTITLPNSEEQRR